MPQVEYKVIEFKISQIPNFGARFSTFDMERELNKMARERWRVASIQAVIGGYYSYETGAWGYSYGYSMTDAFIVVLERQIQK